MRSRFSNDTHGAGDAVLQCCTRGWHTLFFCASGSAQPGQVYDKVKIDWFSSNTY